MLSLLENKILGSCIRHGTSIFCDLKHGALHCFFKRPLYVGCTSGYPSGKQTAAKDRTRYEKLQSFIKNEPDFVSRLNNDFALPYTDIKLVLESFNTESHEIHAPATDVFQSPLFKFYKDGLVPRPTVDFKHICANAQEVATNARNRKVSQEECNVKDVIQLHKRYELVSAEIEKYKKMNTEVNAQQKSISSLDMHAADLDKLHDQLNNSKRFAYCIITILSRIKDEIETMLYNKALQLPNDTHPEVPVGDTAAVLDIIGEKPKFDFDVRDHIFIAEKMNFMRQHNIATLVGKRNYFLMGSGAELEQALVRYALDRLKEKNFVFLSTPNMLRDVIFEGSGLEVNKLDHMVYRVGTQPDSKFCLAGTSELGICTYFTNQSVLYKYLPLRVCALSTCYRRETGTRLDPKGLFRVHQFLKVEMFGVTANETGNESAELHSEFVSIQRELFEELGLHFQVLDMPTGDLGMPAYRKVDLEAWFPGRNKYDEISSASNCTDFQSRRLNILYEKDGAHRFAHTVNATACASTRMIMALLENGQQKDRSVVLPECLRPYMYGKTVLRKEKFWTMKYVGLQQRKTNYVIPT